MYTEFSWALDWYWWGLGVSVDVADGLMVQLHLGPLHPYFAIGR